MKSIYSIDSVQTFEDEMFVGIVLNKEHEIYKAHFPHNPITPGAVLVSIAAELVSQKLGIDTELKEVKNVKFLQPLSPQEHNHICVSFSPLKQPVDVSIVDEDVLFAKMTLIF